MDIQQQRAFFDPTPDHVWKNLPLKPKDEEINRWLARNNIKCPLNKIIVSPENEGYFRILQRFGWTAYSRYNRSCRCLSFGIYCPPGQGKTFIVKQWAETIGIPFIFVLSSGLKGTLDLFNQICAAFEKFGTPIVPHKVKKADYVLPPCIIFFDEAHEVAEDLQKGSLLNAMEPDDGYMEVKTGGKSGERFLVDCYDVCWVAATTDPAELFDAFRSRFLNSIEWVPAGPKELPSIIKAGLEEKVKKKELDFVPPPEACQLIAHYQMVPRLAIHGFGAQVVMQKRMTPNESWEGICKIVAKDLQIDEWGLTRRQVMILAALGQRTIAKSRLGDICKCRAAQIETMELPGLMQYNNGSGPFCASLTGRGMAITEAGLKELDKRGISHKGHKVTVENFESI